MLDPKLTAKVKHVLEDPGTVSVSREYAIALVNAAGSEIDSVLADVAEIVRLLDTEPSIDEALTSGLVSRESQRQMIEKSIIPRCSELVGSFVKVLGKNDRLGLLRSVFRLASQEQEKRVGK